MVTPSEHCTKSAIDTVDSEALKVVNEQFCAANVDEIREIEEHTKQVSSLISKRIS